MVTPPAYAGPCGAAAMRDNGSMAQHHFHLSVQWPGGRNGIGTMACGQLQTRVSIDRRMDGPGVGTNPDELFLSAAGTCYFMTLAALIERAGLALETMSLQSEMTVGMDDQGGFICEKIVHRPRIALAASASAADMAMLSKVITAADRHCMVSHALRNNVAIELRPVLGRADDTSARQLR